MSEGTRAAREGPSAATALTSVPQPEGVRTPAKHSCVCRNGVTSTQTRRPPWTGARQTEEGTLSFGPQQRPHGTLESTSDGAEPSHATEVWGAGTAKPGSWATVPQALGPLLPGREEPSFLGSPQRIQANYRNRGCVFPQGLGPPTID